MLFCLSFILEGVLFLFYSEKLLHQRVLCKIQNCKALRPYLAHLEFVNILTHYSLGEKREKGEWYILDEFWM